MKRTIRLKEAQLRNMIHDNDNSNIAVVVSVIVPINITNILLVPRNILYLRMKNMEDDRKI